MDDTATTQVAPQQDLDSAFNDAVARIPIPVDECFAQLKAIAAVKPDLAGKCIEKLRDALLGAGLAEPLAELYTLWAGSAGGHRPTAKECHDNLKRVTKDRLWCAIADSCAFGEPKVDVSESMRRFNLLRACKPGVTCLDKTWGVGVVRKLDDFYRRMTIDFAAKKNNAMPFAIAAKAISIPPSSHILVQVYGNPAGYAAKVRDNPGQVVRDALASMGPMTIARLEIFLTDNKIVAAGGWKSFWDKARRELKDDPCVEIPAKRNDPLVIHATAPQIGDGAWFQALAATLDSEKILEQVLKFESAGKPVSELSDEQRQIIYGRLAFALKGARNSDHALYARLAFVAARLGLDNPSAAETRAQLWSDDNYILAGVRLAVHDVSHLVAFLLADGEGAVDRLLGDIEKMNYAMVSETLNQLKGRPVGDPAYEKLRARVGECISRANPPATILVWVLRNLWTLRDKKTLEPIGDWRLPSNYVLLGHAFAVSENPNLAGELLHMRNVIDNLLFPEVKNNAKANAGAEADGQDDAAKARAENRDWFRAIFMSLSENQQEAIFAHVRSSGGWEPAKQRGMVGRMIKVNENLKATKPAADSVSDLAFAGRWTSLRSRKERERALERLVKVDIPENVKAIEYGRSLGDLSENFEYQSAKDTERVLHARRESWEDDLRNVRGTDFAEVVPEVAGMGSRVTLRFEDGSTRVFSILGEWDHDEAMSIYSNLSGLAKSIEGRKPGDTATIPTEDGEKTVTVVSVEPLDEAVRAWIAADPAAE